MQNFKPEEHPRNLKDGKFQAKHLPKGKMERIAPSMTEPIDIRASLDESPAVLVGERVLSDGDVRCDYELNNGRRVFTIIGGADDPPAKLDNSTERPFHEYRLMFLGETDEYVMFAEDGSESNHDPDVDLLVGIARIDYSPDGGQKETMLDVQTRSRINDSPRLPPIDFGSLDPAYDDFVGDNVDYGDCNYTYLLEG
ncbi:MAG: hypothetical protein ACYCU8_00425 [Ferrimicrobium acidiphilum]